MCSRSAAGSWSSAATARGSPNPTGITITHEALAVIALDLYLSQPFAQHALIAGALVALTCGLIAPFVVTRGMAFAVHGTSELAFTGAAAGLLVADNALAGALVGAVVVAI